MSLQLGVVGVLVALTGCVSVPELPPLPPTHPGSTSAPEAAVPVRSTLSIRSMDMSFPLLDVLESERMAHAQSAGGRRR